MLHTLVVAYAFTGKAILPATRPLQSALLTRYVPDRRHSRHAHGCSVCSHMVSWSIDCPLQTLSLTSNACSAILSSIFLKEKLTFFGKIGCALCIIGAVVIALNGPSASAAATIPEFLKSFINPLFLSWLSIVTVVSLGLIFWAAPRYGKKNMLVYVSVSAPAFLRKNNGRSLIRVVPSRIHRSSSAL